MDVETTPVTYDVIYCDPPWKFGGTIPTVTKHTDGTATYTDKPLEEYHYPTMSVPEMEQFFSTTVKEMASPDSVLLMWVTDAHLAIGIRLGELAGFEYKTVGFRWLKKTTKGNQVCYMGRWTLKGSEECLLFSRGSAHSKLLKNRKVRQLVEAPRREHSRKPDEVAEAIETMFPDASKIELFARTTRDGWAVHGNETGKF